MLVRLSSASHTCDLMVLPLGWLLVDISRIRPSTARLFVAAKSYVSCVTEGAVEKRQLFLSSSRPSAQTTPSSPSRPFHPLHPDHSVHSVIPTLTRKPAQPSACLSQPKPPLGSSACSSAFPRQFSIRKLCQRRSVKAQQVEGTPIISSTRLLRRQSVAN